MGNLAGFRINYLLIPTSFAARLIKNNRGIIYPSYLAGLNKTIEV
jgi:hypothetical protein